jgi:hypothetical protein
LLELNSIRTYGKDKVKDIEVTLALLIPKRHLKGRGLLKAYKAHNPGIPWQCGTLNTLPHVWHLFFCQTRVQHREGRPNIVQGLVALIPY